MKIIFKIVFLCGMIVLAAFSCEKAEKNCEEEPQTMQIQNLDRLGSDTQYWMQNIDDEKEIVNVVINSQSDYEKYVACNTTLPTIDFKNYTLLSGRMKTPYADHIISQSAVKACNELKYTVTIGEGIATVASKVYYFAIIPKTNATISFNILYQQHQ